MTHSTITIVPKKETLEVFFDSISYSASHYKMNFHWVAAPIRACSESYRLRLGEYRGSSSFVRNLLDDFHKDIALALYIPGYDEPGVSRPNGMAFLCFTASIHFQAFLLSRITRLQVYGPAELDAVARRVSIELIATWRHAPWFVHCVNDAQPEISL